MLVISAPYCGNYLAAQRLQAAAMTDYHTKYQRPEGESTQWEDIHRKLGNFAPAEPVFKPEPFVPAPDKKKDQTWLDERSEGELDDAEDEFADDHFLEDYR